MKRLHTFAYMDILPPFGCLFNSVIRHCTTPIGLILALLIINFYPSVVRFETADLTSRLLIPIIVLQNHNRYNIFEKGHNYSIDVEAIESEVCVLVFSSLVVLPAFLFMDQILCR